MIERMEICQNDFHNPSFSVIFALLTCNFAQFREDFHAEVAE